MAAKNYTDLERAEFILKFENILYSREARQYKDKVKYSLHTTVDQYEKGTVSWPSLLKWYVMARTDRSSGIHHEFTRLKRKDDLKKQAEIQAAG